MLARKGAPERYMKAAVFLVADGRKLSSEGKITVYEAGTLVIYKMTASGNSLEEKDK